MAEITRTISVEKIRARINQSQEAEIQRRKEQAKKRRNAPLTHKPFANLKNLEIK